MLRIALLLAFSLLLGLAAGHGFVELADDNHLISISMAPLAPNAREKQTVLISFVYNDSLMTEPLQANLSVVKNGRQVLFQSKRVAGGVGSFELTYPEEGVYEVFITFATESKPGKVYAPEDIFVQVKNGGSGQVAISWPQTAAALVLALLAGFAFGKKTK